MNDHDCAVMDTRLKEHDRQIVHLYESIDKTNQDIALIKASLNQIKWAVIGGLGFYVVENIGLLEALTL